MLRTRLLYAARKKQFIDKETIGSLEKFTTDKNRALFERLKAFDGKGADEDVQNVFATFKYADSQLTLPQYRARVLQGFDFAVTDKKQPKPALNIKEMSKVAAALAVMSGKDTTQILALLQGTEATTTTSEEPTTTTTTSTTTTPPASQTLADELGFDPEGDDILAGEDVATTDGGVDVFAERALGKEAADEFESTQKREQAESEEALAKVRAQLGFDPEADDMPDLPDLPEPTTPFVPTTPTETGSTDPTADSAISAEITPVELPPKKRVLIDSVSHDPTTVSMDLSKRLFSTPLGASGGISYVVETIEEKAVAEEVEEGVDDDEVLGVARGVKGLVEREGLFSATSGAHLLHAVAEYERLRKAVLRGPHTAPHSEASKHLHNCLHSLALSRMAHMGGHQVDVEMPLPDLFKLFLFYGRRIVTTPKEAVVRHNTNVSFMSAERGKASMFPGSAGFESALTSLSKGGVVSGEAFAATYTEVYPLLKSMFGIVETQMNGVAEDLKVVRGGEPLKTHDEEMTRDALVSGATPPLTVNASTFLKFGRVLQEGSSYTQHARETMPSAGKDFSLQGDYPTTIRRDFAVKKAMKVVAQRPQDIRMANLKNLIQGAQGMWYVKVGEKRYTYEFKGYKAKKTEYKMNAKTGNFGPDEEGSSPKAGSLVEKSGEITWEVVRDDDISGLPEVHECRMVHEWDGVNTSSSRLKTISWTARDKVLETWHRSSKDAFPERSPRIPSASETTTAIEAEEDQ